MILLGLIYVELNSPKSNNSQNIYIVSLLYIHDMVNVRRKSILGIILLLTTVIFSLSYIINAFRGESHTQNFVIPRITIQRSNSQSIDDVVSTELTQVTQNVTSKQTATIDQVFSQDEYIKQKTRIGKEEYKIFNKFGFKRDPQDSYQLKTLFFYWYLKYGVTVENPFEYNDKIKSFAENAVKNINPKNHEERIKAVYLSMQKKLEDSVELSKHVNISWDAKKSMEYYEKHERFPNDCNTTNYLF